MGFPDAPQQEESTREMVSHRLSLSRLHCSLQDLVVGNTANQQQSIIILTAIYAVLTVCQHLTSFKFCGGRISIPTSRMEESVAKTLASG